MIMNRALCAFFVLMTSLAHADWAPPPKPNPDRIFQEAKSDAAAGRYGDALAKHVWYHQNALKHKPSLYGVRLSFALSAWAELGAAYPPALEKLESIRDEAARNVREGKGSREAFHDFASINKTLEDESKTKDLFVWLDSNKPAVAKEVFEVAQPALIKAKEYRLCGSYLEADNAFQRILQLYRENKRIAQEREFGKRLQEFGEKSFSNGTATLVALLVLNERKADAERIAAEAIKEWDDPRFKEQLEKAKKGSVPAPWP
jgi:tetratricopeptide (TPR) repeat protein